MMIRAAITGGNRDVSSQSAPAFKSLSIIPAFHTSSSSSHFVE